VPEKNAVLEKAYVGKLGLFTPEYIPYHEQLTRELATAFEESQPARNEQRNLRSVS
jgi:hypothetical protein